jgi:hypothetical protein
MTTAVQSQSAQQKVEAENFLRRVQVEYPHLLVLGYQAILNATVAGMKTLEIYNENLTEAKFMAGLQHAMNTGIAPPPPAQTLAPVQPTPAELEAKREQDRLAEIGRQKEQAELILRSEQSNPARNGYEGPPSTLDGAKKVMHNLRETVAKREAESLQVYRADGRVDHSKTEQLQKIFANDKHTGAILWQKTLEARKEAATNAEQASRNKRNNSF